MNPRENAPIDAELPWGNVQTRRGRNTEQFFCRYCGRRGPRPTDIAHATNCPIFCDPRFPPTDENAVDNEREFDEPDVEELAALGEIPQVTTDR